MTMFDWKGHRPSANLREEGKMFSVLVHSFLLSDGANYNPPEVIFKLPTYDN